MKWMGKAMNFFMLSCEEATLLMTKQRLGGISFIKSFQLRIHLLSCNLCRRFSIHNDKIDQLWVEYRESHRHLPKEKREEIQTAIEKEYDS